MCGEDRDDNGYGLRFARTAWTSAYLQRGAFQSSPGYSVVVWRGRHVADLHELADEEAAGFSTDVLLVSRALAAHFQPMKMNLLTLGNVVPHLHTHVLPRFGDDPSPGAPLIPPTSDMPGTWDDERLRDDVAALRERLAAYGP
jgi:diadenosine tetraphosphate (Ap4A) HIT family hydrolase